MMIESLLQYCDEDLFAESYSLLHSKDSVSIGSHKGNYKSIASSVCQLLPLECAQSLFLNLKVLQSADRDETS